MELMCKMTQLAERGYALLFPILRAGITSQIIHSNLLVLAKLNCKKFNAIREETGEAKTKLFWNDVL